MRIGLPKGIVKNRSLSVVEKIIGHPVSEKVLKFPSRDINLYLLKHRDIPTLLLQNRLDFGITSSEWLEEREARLHILEELDWCDTRISLIGPTPKSGTEKGFSGTCVTEFPTIASRELRRLGLGSLSIHTVSGSTEALVPDLFDFGVDCVETGQTLKENGLVELECLLHSRVVAVCRRDDLPRGKDALDLIKRTGYL